MPDSQLTTGDSLFILLVGGAIAFAVWAVANSLSLTNRRVSLASLLVLMLLMALAFGLLSWWAKFGGGQSGIRPDGI